MKISENKGESVKNSENDRTNDLMLTDPSSMGCKTTYLNGNKDAPTAQTEPRTRTLSPYSPLHYQSKEKGTISINQNFKKKNIYHRNTSAAPQLTYIGVRLV
jgi:hypothetical protein